jgi:hypothetical protein
MANFEIFKAGIKKAPAIKGRNSIVVPPYFENKTLLFISYF